MAGSSSLDVLIAQLEVQLGSLTSLLVTSPRAGGSASSVARLVAAGLSARGVRTRLLAVGHDESSGAGDTPGSAARGTEPGSPFETRMVAPAEVGSVRTARTLMEEAGTVTVAAADAVLDEPSAIFLAATAGAVLLVAERARTTRSDVERARAEIEAAGGKLVAAVLQE